MPTFISKIAQKDVGKYKVKFTCPKNFNLFSHAQKIDEKILEIIPMPRKIMTLHPKRTSERRAYCKNSSM